jgi:heme/copper-type cytochrome/quinol oxidase subunit 2
MNYIAVRSKVRNVNFLSTLGMLGDTLVVFSLWALWKYRKNKNEAAYEANIAEQTKQNL